MRLLIINADDFGMTDGVCRGIFELLQQGAVSTTTMMLAFPGAARRCREWGLERLAGRVGLHLQLSEGTPLAPRHEVRSLIDPHSGSFRSKDHFSALDPLDVEREWRAQIDAASEILGTRPSHLDSHHGAHHTPGLAQILTKLALEYDLPVRDRAAMAEFMPATPPRGSDVVLYDWTARGLADTDLVAHITRALESSSDSEVLELVTHPGYSDNELRAVSSLNDLRGKELAELAQLHRRRWYDAVGLKLVSFSAIPRRA